MDDQKEKELEKKVEAELEKELEEEEQLSFWRRVGLFVFETLRLIVIVFVTVLLIRTFIVQPFFVVGDSMKPNLHNGDYLLVDEISYRFGSPARGDIIVFRFPGNPRENYIKRIIGLPGETVEIKDGQVAISNVKNPGGMEVEEKYLPADLKTAGNVSRTLEKDEFFVLGDNRGASSDSRSWGTVPRGNIIGRTFVVVFPTDHFSWVPKPAYAGLGEN